MSRNPKRANFGHWNRFPLLDFDQCAMLLLGLEPGTRIEERLVQIQYDRLWQLMDSSRSAGTLEGRYPYHQDIEPAKFIRWAVSVGETPPEDWRPVGTERATDAGPAVETNMGRSETAEPIERQKQDKKSQIDSQIAELREAAVQLCVVKVRNGVEKRYINVTKISTELYDEGKFKNGDAFSSKWHSTESIREYLKGDHNPRSDERYKKAKPSRKSSFN